MKTNQRNFHRLFKLTMALVGALACLLVGCIKKTNNEVVVHAALDREFSQPILDEVGNELGFRVLAKFDQESNKTVGLVTGIIRNSSRPQADIFWNNEILHTMRLQKLGLLEVYRSPMADSFPAQFISSKQQWHGLAARARVLIVNTDLIPNPKDRPSSIYDLADPKWKNKCGIAKPLYGTTATHAAVLFASLGEESAKQLLGEIIRNASVEGGNKQVALKVASGQLAFGLTDTDDAIIELEQGQPVAIVFPDQAENQLGVLLIPNTLAIIKQGPNPERAKRLVDRLLQPDVEESLAAGASAQIPLNTNVTLKSRVEPKVPLKIMAADFQAASDAWDQSVKFLTELLK